MAVLPRRPKGPPLNALRAFEAAARSGSFVLAAQELGVTAGAISQHIKSLETWAGTPLFERDAQGVRLTSVGQKVRADFTSAFDQLAAATQSLRAQAPNPAIHIAALPSIAQLWLPPRLAKLRSMRPELNVSVTALETPPRLSRELFEVSLFFGVPNDDLYQTHIAEDVIFPVCAPNFDHDRPLDDIPLLHDQTWKEDWAHWANATHTQLSDPTRGAQYSLYALAIEEAISGAGAVIGHGCLVDQALNKGTLKRMSEQSIKTGRALILELPHPSRRHPESQTVVNALIDF